MAFFRAAGNKIDIGDEKFSGSKKTDSLTSPSFKGHKDLFFQRISSAPELSPGREGDSYLSDRPR
jgi:hypothetical protein